MGLAVVFATKNGAAHLPRVLDAFAALQPAAVPFRMVAVDNGSTDDTFDILRAEESRGRLPLTVLQERRPGKNSALNLALPLVQDCELVILTDDDVFPRPDWLRRHWDAALSRPGFDLFAGAIEPRWPGQPPAWIFDRGVDLGVVFAATAGRRDGPIPASLVWGPNMAIRGRVLRDGHRFAEDIGPDGATVYAMGSETEFTTRLERHGHRATFVADALVEHLIRPHQLEEAWILARAYRHGLGQQRTVSGPGRRRPSLGLWRAKLLVRYAWLSLLRPAAPWLDAREGFRLCWEHEWHRGGATALLRGRRPSPERRAARGAAVDAGARPKR